jgi:hypothetical protein
VSELSTDSPSATRQVAGQSKAAAGQAAGEVKDTAAEQAQRVGAEAKAQARNLAGDVRGKISEQARTQNDQLVGSIRQTADHLDEMRAQHSDTPAAAVVARVADGGRQVADYLDRNGPEGVLQEVQDFARRRPGTFLATALVAGFVVGRLGKGVAKADPDAGVESGADRPTAPRPTADLPVTGNGYAPPLADTGYPDSVPESDLDRTYPPSTAYVATGTGTPVVVEDEYVLDRPESRPEYQPGYQP